MKRIAGAMLALSLGLATVACSSGDDDSNGGQDQIKVGVVTLMNHPALDAAQQGFIDGLKEAGYTEGENLELDLQNAQGDQSTLTSIANSFASADYDLFYAIATPSAQSLAQVITDKPIVFAAVTDPQSAGLVDSWDKPGGNVTGVSDLNPMDAQIELIHEVVPEAATVGIVYSSGEVNSQVQVTEATEAAQQQGLEIVTSTVTNSSEVQQAAQSLDADVFLIFTDNVVVSAAESVIQVAEQRKVPVFASDGSTVERGAAAGLSVNYTQQGLDAAAVAQRILDGEQPGEIAVETQKDYDLYVNEGAAERQGLTLSADLVSRAAEKY